MAAGAGNPAVPVGTAKSLIYPLECPVQMTQLFPDFTALMAVSGGLGPGARNHAPAEIGLLGGPRRAVWLDFHDDDWLMLISD